MFAFQEITEQEPSRRSKVDHFLFCTNNDFFQLYIDPNAQAIKFELNQLSTVFNQLENTGNGIRNITFAFTAGCFDLQARFLTAFDQYTSSLNEEISKNPIAYRLVIEPLGNTTDAITDTLNRWRGEQNGTSTGIKR